MICARSERYKAAWQTGQQPSERALNHKQTTKSQKLEFRPSLRLSNARIFAKIAPVFCLSLYKNVISVDQSWIRAGHIQGDVFEPFSGSGMAIGGRQIGPNWLKEPLGTCNGAIRHQ